MRFRMINWMKVMRRWCAVICVTAAVAAQGCTSSPPPPQVRAGAADKQVPAAGVAPITNTDACATRMHDISGALLLFYQKFQRLPERLDDLRQISEFSKLPEFSCPVSKRPYLYAASGISSPEPNARIVLYDPTPAHGYHRWAVSIIEPESPRAPLVTKVIALPASGFRIPAP